MKSERALEAEVVRRAKAELGVRSSKLALPGQTGLPDRIFWVPGGAPVLVEFKREDGVLSDKQELWVGYLRKVGYRVVVARTPDEALGPLRVLLELDY